MKIEKIKSNLKYKDFLRPADYNKIYNLAHYKEKLDILALELYNGIIVLEAVAMLHDTDAEFAIIDSAHQAIS